MPIDVSPDLINQMVAEAIAKSAIGSSLQAAIDEQIKVLARSYDNPFKQHIQSQIIEIIKEMMETEFKEQMREIVRQKITNEFIDEVMNSLWDKFLERRF